MKIDFARLRRAEHNCETELRAIQEDIAAHKTCLEREARERAMISAVARSQVFRDGTPRNMPAHREIARRYAWHAHKAKKSLPRPTPGQTGKSKLITLKRLRELELIISVRHGAVLPNDRYGREMVAIVGHHIAHAGAGAAPHIVAWASFWAPWMPPSEAAALAASIIAEPLKFRADTLGWRLRLSHSERTALGVTTIGGFDVNKAERERLRKLRRAAADRKRRQQKGAIPRLQYQAQSHAQTQPWAALGMSRATWYRRGMPDPKGAFGEDREHKRAFSYSNPASETGPRPAGDSCYAGRIRVSPRAPAGAAARKSLPAETLVAPPLAAPSGAAGDAVSETAHPRPVHGENLAHHLDIFPGGDCEHLSSLSSLSSPKPINTGLSENSLISPRGSLSSPALHLWEFPRSERRNRGLP